MKAYAFWLLLLPLAMTARADPDAAPFINHQIKELNKKIGEDAADGTLTKTDADELSRAVAHVKSDEDSQPLLTPRTRRDLREQLSKITQDLKRKEAQAKALASPSASPDFFASPSPTP